MSNDPAGLYCSKSSVAERNSSFGRVTIDGAERRIESQYSVDEPLDIPTWSQTSIRQMLPTLHLPARVSRGELIM